MKIGALMFPGMKRAFFMILALALAAFVDHARAQPAEAPRVLVELYTAQGCSACPRANRLLGDIREDEADVLALTFPVGYWDYLGWIDTLARPEFSDRQRDYMRALQFRGLSTPQFIVNGAAQVRGGDREAVQAALAAARAAPSTAAPRIEATRTRQTRARFVISGGRAPQAEADIWLATYDPGPLMVRIRAGENRGRIVTHYNVVRRLLRVGGWSGQALTLDDQSCWPRCALLIQAPRGGAMLGFAAAPPPD